jgi:hypothetical protein
MMAMAAGMRTRAGGSWPALLQRVVTLDEGADGFHRSWIMLFPVGQFEHEQYGTLTFSRATLAEIKRNFDARVRHIDIALDVDHKASGNDSRATGWLEQVELRDASGETPAGLWGRVMWTPYGMRLLQDREYRYFSPEFGSWTDPENGQKYDNVLIGGALTNRPFLKVMPSVQLSEKVSHKSWARVNKSKLPRSCFLDKGDPDDRSTWRLPIYEGAGPLDAQGHYTKRGPLNIHAVRAALAALGGARTGKAMTGVPAGTRAKLERLLQRYGGVESASGDARAASEGGTDMTKKRDGRDEREELAEDETDGMEFAADDETEEYAERVDPDGDGDDDSSEEGDTDEDFDHESDRHGPMTVKGHAHGRYARHSHDGDGDHSEAPLKEGKRGGRTMAEPAAQVRLLREQLAEQNRQMREMRFQLFEQRIDKVLDGWDNQQFQFVLRESPTKNGDAGKVRLRTGRIAMSPKARAAIREYMLSEGFTLSEGKQNKLLKVFETAMAGAVDLSQRGSSYDMDEKRAKRTAGRDVLPESVELAETAERLALADGKTLMALSSAEQERYFLAAARETNYGA